MQVREHHRSNPLCLPIRVQILDIYIWSRYRWKEHVTNLSCGDAMRRRNKLGRAKQGKAGRHCHHSSDFRTPSLAKLLTSGTFEAMRCKPEPQAPGGAGERAGTCGVEMLSGVKDLALRRRDLGAHPFSSHLKSEQPPIATTMQSRYQLANVQADTKRRKY